MAVKPVPPLSPLEHKLLALARREDVSIDQLAKGAGLSGETLRKWMRKSRAGDFGASIEHLEKLAERYDVTIAWLRDNTHPTEDLEVDAFEPTQGTLARIRTRLLKRGYPAPDVNEVLLTAFDGIRTEEDLFDAAEAELAARGFAAKFGKPALGTSDPGDDVETGYKPGKGPVMLAADSAAEISGTYRAGKAKPGKGGRK